jgi:hypothetical protein
MVILWRLTRGEVEDDRVSSYEPDQRSNKDVDHREECREVKSFEEVSFQGPIYRDRLVKEI